VSLQLYCIATLPDSTKTADPLQQCILLNRFFQTYSQSHSMFNEHSTPCPGKKCHFIFDYNSRISCSIFILFVPMETGMNTPKSYVICLLNCLMTSYLWYIANHDSLTLVYMLKLTISSLKIDFRLFLCYF